VVDLPANRPGPGWKRRLAWSVALSRQRLAVPATRGTSKPV